MDRGSYQDGGAFGTAPQRPSAFSSKPTTQELIHLKQELAIWMTNTRYQLQGVELSPVWRVQNMSMVLSTGAGIGAFFLQNQWRPGSRFPWSVVPACVTFYLAHAAAQAFQLPGLYEAFLGMDTPIGARTRDILQALRTGGRLPSHEFGTRLPGSRQAPRQAAQPPAPSDTDGGTSGFGAGGGGDDFQVPSSAPADFGFGAPPPELGGGAGGTGAAPAQQPQTADPWADVGGFGAPPPAGSPAWGGDAWGQPETRPSRPQRRTWEEIRTQAAQQQAERGK